MYSHLNYRQWRCEDFETSFIFFTTITKSKSNVDFEGETGVAGKNTLPEQVWKPRQTWLRIASNSEANPVPINGRRVLSPNLHQAVKSVNFVTACDPCGYHVFNFFSGMARKEGTPGTEGTQRRTGKKRDLEAMNFDLNFPVINSFIITLFFSFKGSSGFKGLAGLNGKDGQPVRTNFTWF